MPNTNESIWIPIKGHIMTTWVKDVSPDNPLPEYPRPQLKRDEWKSLNGLWDYAIQPRNKKSVESFDGKILVPFCIESALSGVKKKLGHRQRLWYHRKVSIPESWKNMNILLHFGAVDWEATVWINGKKMGTHKGGYVPFSFEISEYLKKDINDIHVVVWDPTNKGSQERGKQTLRPWGIYYTAISGIWQTVWLEPVPASRIESIRMVPDIDQELLNLSINVHKSKSNDMIHLEIRDGEQEIYSLISGIKKNFKLKITNPKLWSLESPFLYDLTIKLERDGKIIDKVTSYFGMRKIGLGNDENGILRIELNNKPIFQYGTLDQGYWPDGLYTAPTDEALRYDIEITKELGFNMIRKHVKVEPARWYYHCDKLGMLVWQDMPSGGKQIVTNVISPFLRGKESKKNYWNELKAMISTLYNSPSVVVWIPFNESWGQFQTKKVVNWIKNYDSSRLVDNVSGWFDKNVGDIRDIHNYPGPKMPKLEENRAAVLGEFGGLGLKVKDHIWGSKLSWSYRQSPNPQRLYNKYAKLISKLKPLIKEGLCAAIYTQITDIEAEINGLLTYDREITKINKEKLKELNLSLFE